MSDIKKFTGYVSSDGKTHNSQKAAVAHELELKTQAAVKAAFPVGTVIVTSDDGTVAAPAQAISDFVLRNRVLILAALQQEVLLRKKRTPKVKAPAANDANTQAAA
jgi:hypothetical protein